MVDRTLLDTLAQLTPEEQKAILAVADDLESQPSNEGAPAVKPEFAHPDEGLSPARLAARRFMRENPVLMRLLAQ